MPHWTALIPAPAPATALDAQHLAWWCLQFTPRVALLEEAVVMEWQASERLFGGQRTLLRQLATGAREAGCLAWAHARTGLGALALARTPLPRPRTLDALPLASLSAVAAHEATLSRLGCRTLGDVRRLPRSGLSRRLGAAPLRALDQAQGLLPETFEWICLPNVFDARLELPGRVDTAPQLQVPADILLQRLCAWLAGRQAGVRSFTLRWQHDGQRRDAASAGEWLVRLATPSRDLRRLQALLKEHLQRISLIAPVGELALHADDFDTMVPPSGDLFQQTSAHHGLLQADALRTPAAQRAQHDALMALLDKLSVRLGPAQVLQGQPLADHRLSHSQCWWPVTVGAVGVQGSPAMPVAGTVLAEPMPKAPHRAPMPLPLSNLHLSSLPCPTWLLPTPLPLSLDHGRAALVERPVYQGPLTLLAGPHRIEAGWWDTQASGPPALVARDYHLASSAHAGLLWVYRARHAPGNTRSSWFLHGLFA
jgi:protein ImuB